MFNIGTYEKCKSVNFSFIRTNRFRILFEIECLSYDRSVGADRVKIADFVKFVGKRRF